jgi:hypothetical protein
MVDPEQPFDNSQPKYTPDELAKLNSSGKWFMASLMITKRGRYILSSMLNDGEETLDWAGVLRVFPKLDGHKELFVYQDFSGEEMEVVSENDKYDEKNYFEIIAKDHEWPTYYAMNWISQISFFQHYIFHQIMYVTGAPGQGKSTQVPKLFLYASKMYDYNSKTNIICTAPRIQPVLDNSNRISDEIGLPITQFSNSSNIKIKTDNYVIQYTYEADNHNKKNTNNLILNIVTD